MFLTGRSSYYERTVEELGFEAAVLVVYLVYDEHRNAPSF